MKSLIPPAELLLDKYAVRSRKRRQVACAILEASLRRQNFVDLDFKLSPTLQRELEVLGYSILKHDGRYCVRWDIQ